jgi:predicted alpha-1,2-mannosidase
MIRLFIIISVTVATPLIAQKDFAKYVNPFIGTEKMGHTYPGATAPFGSVQLSPDTDTIPFFDHGKYNKNVYKYCSGYRYEDKTIVGFSHTHFSGTGHSDLGDFLIMPTVGPLQMNPGTSDQPDSGYRSRFSHEQEKAEPGFYQVYLQDYQIMAELTATTRVGLHQYTFPESKDAHIILDLMHGIYNYEDKTTWTYVRVINDTLVMGYRQTNGWARNRTVYFAMTFSKPFKNYGRQDFEKGIRYNGFWRKFDQEKNFPEIAGKKIRMHFDFETSKDEQIKIKFALSPISQRNALENLNSEIPNWDFNGVRQQTRSLWNKELGKIEMEGDASDKMNFYTALYHAFLSPTIYMDVDMSYKGLDQEIYTAESFTHYTTFSIWDTYRALHPLFNIVQQKRNNDMVHSMMQHYKQNAVGMLPIWSHYANENWCMSGYHSVSILADAILKGVYKGDPHAALDACIVTSTKLQYEGIGDYIDMGYIPDENNGNSVSNALEYAYDDWSIAQLAASLDRSDDYLIFKKRSENWINNFDSSLKLMRPRKTDGSFRASFDPLETHGQGFIEGNSWNYSFFVPHDPENLVVAMGGETEFALKLDTLFNMHLPDEYFEKTEDVSREGIIGGYVHGNEPAHHVPYLYNWSAEPWKTQSTVRKVLKNQYKPTPDGLGGNDDCGQMSAWFIFSSLGFYPVAPVNDWYALGSPSINHAVINLENGQVFNIMTQNQSPDNVYVQKVTLNGIEINDNKLYYNDIMKGGNLIFYMGNIPRP